ncbi:MAG: MFS transporter [Thiohalocapsa sp.]|nr:MFS transporter [Thiohalocapsa sp.]
MDKTLAPLPDARVHPLDSLYDLVTGDEDARVCKDIPPASCNDQPRNFFAYLGANLLTKVADEVSSAKLILPWLLSALGAPAVLIGFLVPIREAGVLLPQLAVAAAVRSMPVRKVVWIWGALLSALALALMAIAAATLTGAAAGWVVVALLVVFSLARGLCSVSAKDVLGKTVSKARRGNLMGLSAGIAGRLTLALGLYLQFAAGGTDSGIGVFVLLLGGGALLFAASAAVFGLIAEQPGATEGGGNALQTALASIGLLRTDPLFRRFVLVRISMLTVALAPPFYVLLIQQRGGGLGDLGLLIIASGLASSLSAPIWGRLSDRSSRLVMVLSAAAAGIVGVITWALAAPDSILLDGAYTFAVLFLLLGIAHAGVRLGRKVYLVDMATAGTRAAMVAVSNTVIGVAMLAGGAIGVLADVYDAATVVLVLGVGALGSALYAMMLKEVSEPE